MKALVINLESAKQRMAFQSQQLSELEIHYARMPAFSIESPDDPIYLDNYHTWKRLLGVSEVSCFFSHKKAWEYVVELNEPVLILEDDALLATSVPSVLKELSKMNSIDYANFEVSGESKKKTLANQPTFVFSEASLVRLYQGRRGSAAYVLWTSGANKLLNTAKHHIGLADGFINQNYSLNAYQVEPAVAIQLDQVHMLNLNTPLATKTSINRKIPIPTSKFAYLRCRVRRLLGEIKVGLRFLRHCHHAKRRAVAISNQFERLHMSDNTNRDNKNP